MARQIEQHGMQRRNARARNTVQGNTSDERRKRHRAIEDCSQQMNSRTLPRRVSSPKRTCLSPQNDQTGHREAGSVWQTILQGRRNSMRRCSDAMLIIIGVIQMVSGMIFASVFVVLTFSPDEVTKDLQYPLPIYLSSVIICLSGLCEMVLSKIHNPYMIFTGIFFSISSCVISLAGSLSVGTVAFPKFSSFIHFHYDEKSELCMAYTQWDRQTNGTFTGGVSFQKMSSCSVIEFTLPPISLTLGVTYGISCLTSFMSCFILALMLCSPDLDQKGGKEKNRPRHKEQTTSYINYGLDLDNLCDFRGHENCDISPVKKKKASRDLIPGVAVPFYTLPYRIRVEDDDDVSRTHTGIACPATSHLPHPYVAERRQTSCGCDCRVINVLDNTRDAVISSSLHPSTISATLPSQRSYERPSILNGFHSSANEIDVNPLRGITGIERADISQSPLSPSRSEARPLQLDVNAPRMSRNLHSPRNESRRNGLSTVSPTRRVAIARRSRHEGRDLEVRRRERSENRRNPQDAPSTRRNFNIPSPPPYSELSDCGISVSTSLNQPSNIEL